MEVALADSEKIKVVFIGGSGRSGSTLIDRILGEIEGFFSVGELRYIWERGFSDNQLCGCGMPFRECDFWNAVTKEAFGRIENGEIDRIRKLKHFVDRKRNIFKLVFSFIRSKEYIQDKDHYAEVLVRLYRAVKEVSGCDLIIDSSKNPSYGFLLSSIPEIDLYVVHLVRDSRGTSFSWLRKRVRPEITGKRETMPIIGPLQSAIEWLVLNGLTEWLGIFNTKYLFCRYEDFVNNAGEAIRNILSYVEETGKSTDFIRGNVVSLGINHTVSGNPMRFKKGEVEIRSDTEWRFKLGNMKKLSVTISTLALLVKYGYISLRRNDGIF
jgi:hypothetical protein